MSTNFDEQQWRAELEGHRDHKDDFFATERQSPIPEDQRDAFDGLSYFEPDPAYRVEANIDPIDSDDTITMETTVETEQEYERVARLTFELAGEERTLVAYSGVNQDGDSLFVPFRDKTTGQQTYGAGRYMEFEVDGEVTAADTVVLDFNLAYHPFCAYNDAFACPLPPEENWLDVPIEAGEKLPDA
ncbi:DUF1684 domain-containing protein [Halosegnis longus]|uniref:DUF1684 domain-containing protein n=1 Tax=Halosegnis longus TaxID=2216012 RepID=A0AAJ4R6J4_9EURY|nr:MULTISPECIES: DUF1684 domain-containing protein [Halobacteriales]RNJ25348.1 DUF1684 domain-containing protein [Salella cibi]